MMRRRAAVVALVLIAAATAVAPLREAIAGAVSLELRHRAIAAYTLLLPPAPDTADLEPMKHLSHNPYAFNVFLEQEVEEWKIRRTLQMVRAAGFGWIKQQLVWAEVETPRRGAFVDRHTGAESWRKYDRIVDLAAEYGLRVIFRVDTSPEWARPGRPKLETPPDDPADYAAFLGRVAARYRGRVDHLQVWNEPNLPFEWGGMEPDAAAYTRLLALAARSARTANPDVVILSAAMAPTTEFSEKGINELVYLQRMYDQGARWSFDVLGANAYGLLSGPDDRRVATDRDVNFSRPQLVRALMVRNGDRAKPLWAAEVGWNSLPLGFPEPSLYGQVDRRLQALYTARAYERAQREWPWMGVMALWHFRLVAPEGPRLQQYYFNAVRDDFSPEPLYEAMVELAHRPRVVERGYRQEDDWRIEADASWRPFADGRAVAGAYIEARAPGAALRLVFRGTDFDLVIGRQPGGGALEVRVDGLSAVRVETDGTTTEFGQRAPIAAMLPDGLHAIEMRTIDERPVRIDGLVVDRSAPPVGLDLTTLMLAAGIAATIAAARRGPG